MDFDEADKQLVNKFLIMSRLSGLNGVSTIEQLWSICEPGTKQLINRVTSLDPRAYGFNGKALPLEPVPKDIIEIKNKTGTESGEYSLSATVYLPKDVHGAFTKMSESFTTQYPQRKLMVGSGYRSPAFQIITLIYILAKIYDFDIARTLQRVALPEYSQHCSATRTAIDMMNIDGEPTDEDSQRFGDSVEYKWLLKNAQKFNFYESYPPGNPDGIMWEPWHWQYRP